MPSRRARRGGATLIALPAARSEASLCAVCTERLMPGEPVAWTITKRRIHESCIGTARLVGTERRKLAPTDAMDLIADQRLCAACFAMQKRISLADAKRLIALAMQGPHIRRLAVMCSSCHREESMICK
jgi:hypothetical protein